MKPGNQEAEVLNVERIRTAALVAVDLTILEKITDASYTHVESNGVARNKAGFLDGLAKGAYRFESFIIEEITSGSSATPPS